MWEQLYAQLPWLGEGHWQAAVLVPLSIIAAFMVQFLVRITLGTLARRTRTDLDDRTYEAMRRPIFLTVLMSGLYAASSRLDLPVGARFALLASLETLGVMVWSLAAYRVGHILLEAISRRARKDAIVQPRTLPILDIGVKVGVVAAGLYFTFLAWHIDLTAWLASAGILGIAVGFAAKDSLANLFSGIFIVADGPYKVGDYIVLDGILRGAVSHIGIRSTRILTRDDVEITVPNAVIAAAKIVNESGGPYVKQRVAVSVDAAYGSDVDRVREVLLTCPEGVPDVCDTPAPQVRFRAFGGSGLNFELLVWLADPAQRGLLVDRLNTRVYKRFAEAGIEIPYSKHDVYIKEMPRS